jgi:G3E family GTPase
VNGIQWDCRSLSVRQSRLRGRGSSKEIVRTPFQRRWSKQHLRGTLLGYTFHHHYQHHHHHHHHHHNHIKLTATTFRILFIKSHSASHEQRFSKAVIQGNKPNSLRKPFNKHHYPIVVETVIIINISNSRILLSICIHTENIHILKM